VDDVKSEIEINVRVEYSSSFLSQDIFLPCALPFSKETEGEKDGKIKQKE